MTDEVAVLVLRNNSLQGQALTLLATESRSRGTEQAEFLRALERSGDQLAESIGTMADGVFLVRFHLRESHLKAVGNEDRVVAEALVPARRKRQMSTDFALK